jgi:hypothetical protein
MSANKSHYQKLKHRLVKRHEDIKKKVWDKHALPLTELAQNAKQVAMGSVGGLMLLTSPAAPILALPDHGIIKEVGTIDLDKNVFFISDLATVLPDNVRPLTAEEEKKASGLLSEHYGISVSAEVNGLRLNRSYGYIGAEQHLARYPGDTMETHFDNPDDAAKHWSSGMAPGLGAWGYFVPAGQQMSEVDVQREKYYIAVQTFLSPNFQQRIREYRDFYKFRKMLVVNPDNGKAVVAVIGDAGPAQWTGKSLGGSPEVMNYLERVDGRAKGAVLYFFVDDPDDTIPLGPVESNIEVQKVN